MTETSNSGKKRSFSNSTTHIGSVTDSFLRKNLTSVRSIKDDMNLVTVLLVDVATELDNGNYDIVPLLQQFGRRVKDLNIGVTGYVYSFLLK